MGNTGYSEPLSLEDMAENNEEEVKPKEESEKIKDADLPEGWMDWNTLSLDQMADYLEKEYQFQSSGEAKCICSLIDFYRQNKK